MTNNFVFICILLCSLISHSLPVDQIHDFDSRYQLKNKNEKLVDNYGNNYEDLYGVRNFRAVLRGLVYRGGGNNSYNKYGKRPNMNPLPNIGLNNLCKEGFHGSIYLYSTNFKSAPSTTACRDSAGTNNETNYLQITAFDEHNTEEYLKYVFDMIQGQNSGPLYIHCWNGWHASGLVSALILRQFCNVSAQDALAYWIENTDGNSNGYDEIKDRIKNFKPLEKYKVPKDVQNQICYAQ